jgi:hypothetical protein
MAFITVSSGTKRDSSKLPEGRATGMWRVTQRLAGERAPIKNPAQGRVLNMSF